MNFNFQNIINKEKRNKVSILFLLAYIGSIITIFIFIFNLFPKLSRQGIAGIIIIGIISIWFLIDNIIIRRKLNKTVEEHIEEFSNYYEDYTYLEKYTKYAKIISKINLGLAKINEIIRFPNITSDNLDDISNNLIKLYPQLTKEDTRKILIELCTTMADVFKEITDSDCSICIKIVKFSKNSEKKTDYEVYTLCRDRNHIDSRNLPALENVKHIIEKNTDFNNILINLDNRKGKYFFSNNLPARYEYQNTSFEVYGKIPPDLSYEERYEQWTLPYKSTIITPICPNIAEERTQEKILGFFCVDSEKIDIFNEDYDPNILIGISDAIYNLIKIFTLLK